MCFGTLLVTFWVHANCSIYSGAQKNCAQGAQTIIINLFPWGGNSFKCNCIHRHLHVWALLHNAWFSIPNHVFTVTQWHSKELCPMKTS